MSKKYELKFIYLKSEKLIVIISCSVNLYILYDYCYTAAKAGGDEDPAIVRAISIIKKQIESTASLVQITRKQYMMIL